MNAKVDRLMQKHKKLKRRYQTLQDDLYVDSEDISQTEPQKLPLQQEPQQEVQQPLATQESATQPKVTTRSVRSVKNGGRSQITFL